MRQQRVVISVTNDLVTDQRVHKIALCLHENAYEVLVLGRLLPTSTALHRPYKTHRFRLPFRNGPLFYASYNIRLFLHLVLSKADVFYANDLDTLPANYLASLFRRKEVVYDSHEYFTEVPELVNRKRVQSIWRKIEKTIVPRLKYCITVSASIAEIYTRKYHVPFQLVRNMPRIHQPEAMESDQQNRLKQELGIPAQNKVIIYQGAINLGRGIELMIEALPHVQGVTFLVMGAGDIEAEVKNLAHRYQVDSKIIFTGKIPFEKLQAYTQLGDLGISLEEDLGLNYRYALPNKLFDYIHCGIPVLVSNLPEMSKLVEHYQIGEIFKDERTGRHLAQCIQKMLTNEEQLQKWTRSCLEAQKQLNWDSEFQKLLKMMHTICFSPHIPRHH